jgi:hypothetical protein
MDWLENEIDSVLYEALKKDCFILEQKSDLAYTKEKDTDQFVHKSALMTFLKKLRKRTGIDFNPARMRVAIDKVLDDSIAGPSITVREVSETPSVIRLADLHKALMSVPSGTGGKLISEDDAYKLANEIAKYLEDFKGANIRTIGFGEDIGMDPEEEETPEEEPGEVEDAPRVRISTELGAGDFAAYKFMGQTKTVGDPADKKALEYFKDDETIPMSAKGPELYAELAKNYAMSSILKTGKFKTGISEAAKPDEALITKVSQSFASYLTNFKGRFDESIEKTKDVRKSFLALEEDLSLDLQKLKKENQKAMKAKESSERLVNNFTTSQQLTIKLANYLMEALNLMYVEASQFLQDQEFSGEEEGEEKMKTGTEPGKVELNEDKLVEIVIDFNEIRKNEMNESFLAMFGGWVEHILKAMFGGLNIPVNVRGSDREVQAFATALGREKRYIDVAKRYGLDHASTYRSKAQLDSAAKNFQRETGIKWPFK